MSTGQAQLSVQATAIRVGHYRWVVCGLLFLAATINYIDRQVLGILKPTLQAEFGWSELDYADIVFSFQLAYAIGLLLAGRVIDRLGAKTGFTIFIVLWSLAAIAHAEAPVFGGAAEHRRFRVRDGREAPEHDEDREAGLRAEPIDHAPGEEQADRVRELEREHDVRVVQLAPAELGLQRGLEDPEDLAIDVVDRRGEEQQSADHPAV